MGKRVRGGGVSQKIWVPANGAVSCADRDNRTIVVCLGTRDSSL